MCKGRCRPVPVTHVARKQTVDERTESASSAQCAICLTHRKRLATSSLNHFVRAQQQQLRDRQAERLRGLHVDDELPVAVTTTVHGTAYDIVGRSTANPWALRNLG
jgi:hypothetical protein